MKPSKKPKGGRKRGQCEWCGARRVLRRGWVMMDYGVWEKGWVCRECDMGEDAT